MTRPSFPSIRPSGQITRRSISVLLLGVATCIPALTRIGPVILTLPATPEVPVLGSTHGVHLGDLVSLPLLWLAGRWARRSPQLSADTPGEMAAEVPAHSS